MISQALRNVPRVGWFVHSVVVSVSRMLHSAWMAGLEKLRRSDGTVSQCPVGAGCYIVSEAFEKRR